MPGTLVAIGRNGPADLLGRIRLHVPGVELRWAADQEQQDAIDVAISRYGPSRRQGLHRRQPEPERRQRPGVQEIAASQPITKVDRLLGVDSGSWCGLFWGGGRAGKSAGTDSS